MVWRGGGRRVEGLGETAQQVTHLLAHVSHGDGFPLPRVGPRPDAERLPPAAAGAVKPLGQLAEEEAAGELPVELAQGHLVLQEIPQTHTVLQQQPHKLGLVADEGREHGPVEVTGLEPGDEAGATGQSAPQHSLGLNIIHIFRPLTATS